MTDQFRKWAELRGIDVKLMKVRIGPQNHANGVTAGLFALEPISVRQLFL